MWLSAVVAVTLLACANKLNLLPPIFYLCRTEIAEHRQNSTFSKTLFKPPGYANTAAHYHHINVVRWAFKEQVAHVAAHHIALKAETISGFRNSMKDVFIKEFRQFGIAK